MRCSLEKSVWISVDLLQECCLNSSHSSAILYCKKIRISRKHPDFFSCQLKSYWGVNAHYCWLRYIFHQCLSLGFGVYRCGGDSHFSFSQPCCLLWRQLHSSAVAGAGAGRRRGDGECWDQLPSAHSWHAAAALRTQLPWQRQTWCSWSRHQWSMFHKLSWSLLPWQTDLLSECINIKFLNQP